MAREGATRNVGGAGRLAWVAVASAVAGFVACLVAWRSGAPGMDVPWAPTLDLRLDLRMDGLGALYGLLATGIGAAVFAYGAAYLPWHLEHGAEIRTRRAASGPGWCCSWRRWSAWRARATSLAITVIASLLKARRDPLARAHPGSLRDTREE